MKKIRISTDISCFKNKKDKIKSILFTDVVPLLQYHFKVLEMSTEEDSFIRIDIDVDDVVDVKMDYFNIVNYCHDLCQIILYHQGFDCITSCYPIYNL